MTNLELMTMLATVTKLVMSCKGFISQSVCVDGVVIDINDNMADSHHKLNDFKVGSILTHEWSVAYTYSPDLHTTRKFVKKDNDCWVIDSNLENTGRREMYSEDRTINQRTSEGICRIQKRF